MATESKGADDGPTKIVMSTEDCPVDVVCVFCDRAEVTRTIKVDVEGPGEYELRVEGLPACVDTDSVRVNGTGHVVLEEVSFGIHHKPVVEVVPDDATAERDPKVVRQDMDRLDHEIAVLTLRKDEVERSLALLTSYTDKMLKHGTEHEGDAAAMEASMNFAFALLERQQAKTREFNSRLTEIADEVAAKHKLLAVCRERLAAIGAARHVRPRTVVSRDVTVVFTATKASEVNLRLLYMVSNASWTPAYDARINSEDTNVSLTYYGMVRQTTTENWQNAKLVLSTATPSVGGSAPILPTKHVRFLDPIRVQRKKQKNMMRRSLAAAAPRPEMMMNMQAAMFDMEERVSLAAAPPPMATAATAKVESSGAATTFHIERRATVDSDNKGHKVTVAILNLSSRFRHYAVPALNTVAYLQCLTTNTSDYTLLSSDMVNVFMDGSFISKTSIVTVAPGEKFRTFLGVDKAVKVEYRPVGAVHEEKGFFSKTDEQRFKFVTTIKNAKSMPIRMVVADMLPRSDDATIKVKLVSPTAEEVAEGTKMQETKSGEPSIAQVRVTNNLVWQYDVMPGDRKKITFEYTVEHPANRSVTHYKVEQGSHAHV